MACGHVPQCMPPRPGAHRSSAAGHRRHMPARSPGRGLHASCVKAHNRLASKSLRASGEEPGGCRSPRSGLRNTCPPSAPFECRRQLSGWARRRHTGGQAARAAAKGVGRHIPPFQPRVKSQNTAFQAHRPWPATPDCPQLLGGGESGGCAYGFWVPRHQALIASPGGRLEGRPARLVSAGTA